ncbi:MAG TPA: glycosyl hydrolase family 28 protein [Sphingomonas sp.]|nr:glycosyl hydrolase family 28 protein [Sphingomonas sp.]
MALNRRDFVAAAGLVAPSAALAGSLVSRNVPATPRHRVSISVRATGAAGDGRTLDTLAFQQALDRCAMLGGGEVVVPAGAYLIGAVAIGPATTLRLEEGATVTGSPDLADYPVRQVRWEGKFVPGRIGLVSAENADGIAITGGGRLVGNPTIASRVDRATGLRNPALIELVNCNGVDIGGIATQQNAMWSIHPLFCSDVRFHDMVVNGGADGIDVDSCERVTIERCSFDTGDDCIAIKSGRGEEGNRIARPTTDVRIADCTFRDHRWACVAIGSETSGGVRGVRVERCRMLGAGTHAVYIKSRPGRGAFIEDVTMTDLDIAGTAQGFLRLNFAGSGKQDENPVPGLAGIPTVRNFRFANVRLHDVPALVEATEMNPEKPLADLTLASISGTARAGIRLAHIRHAVVKDIHVTGTTGPLIQAYDVSGSGLEGAAPLPPPTASGPVPAPAEPYVLR